MSKKEASLVFNNMSSFLDKHEDNIYLVSEMDCDKEVRILPLVVLEKNIPSYESVLRKQKFWIQRQFQWIITVYPFLSDLVLWSWITILGCGSSWGCLWIYTLNLREKLWMWGKASSSWTGKSLLPLEVFFFFFPETLRSSNCHSIYSFFNLQLVPQCRLVLAFGEALI